MAKNTTQIALIQNRRGKLSELPTELNEGEFGLATDTNQLFIGNSTNEQLSKRVSENIFPYGNIEILTEFSDNLQKIKYVYESNTENVARFPIILKGSKANPKIDAQCSIKINGVDVFFKNSSELSLIVKTINNVEDLDVRAYEADGQYLGLITTGTEIYIEDGVIKDKSIVGEILGFGSDSYYSETSETLPERTLQDRLDDNLSIKAFGVLGDGETNDGEAFNKAILSSYGYNNDLGLAKSMLIPSGTYIIDNTQIMLVTNTHLKGEGMGHTIIKAKNCLGALLVFGDSNYISSRDSLYCTNAESPADIIIEDMTFDASDCSLADILYAGASKRVQFKNVEFICSDNGNAVTLNGNSTNKVLEMSFLNCRFHAIEEDEHMGKYAIYDKGASNELTIKDCDFFRFAQENIWLSPTVSGYVNNSALISGCRFELPTNVTRTAPIIRLGSATQYCKITSNIFTNGPYYNDIKPYEDDGTYNTIEDIYNPAEDEKKLLQFKFNNPQWQYIDYLANPNGEYVLQSTYDTVIVDGEEVIPSLTNGLTIHQGDSTNNDALTLSTSIPYGTLNLTNGAYGTINIGNYDVNSSYSEYNELTYYTEGTSVYYLKNDGSYAIYKAKQNTLQNALDDEDYWEYIGTYNPSIIFHKELDVNDNSIVNNGSLGNIDFTVKNDGILTITNDSDNGVDDYNDKISSILNAIPTVKYVNTTAQSSIIKTYNFNNLTTDDSSMFQLVTFTPEKYGDVVNLDRISVNVRRPFYPIQALIANAKNWQQGSRYYSGDVVIDSTDTTKTQYMMCIEDHFATEDADNIQYGHWTPVYTSGVTKDGSYISSIPDPKYVEIIAINRENPSDDITDNVSRLLFKRNEVDISKRDIKAKYYPTWTAGTTYNLNDYVSYNNRYYKCVATTSTSADDRILHDITNWVAVQEEGYNYIYEFERDITPITTDDIDIDYIPTDNNQSENGVDYVYEIAKIYNYSGYTLYLKFLDEDMQPLPVIKFSPLADISITDFEGTTIGTVDSDDMYNVYDDDRNVIGHLGSSTNLIFDTNNIVIGYVNTSNKPIGKEGRSLGTISGTNVINSYNEVIGTIGTTGIIAVNNGIAIGYTQDTGSEYHMQLSGAGYLVVTIHYIRGENDEN